MRSACTLIDCEERVHAKGLCKKHWSKQYNASVERKAILKERYWANRDAYLQYNYENSKKPKNKYCYAKHIAKRRNLEFVLTKDQYVALIVQGCFYCGKILNSQGVSLDRLDNSLGYTLENVVPCCGFCNDLKGDLLSKEETLRIVNFLKESRHTSNIWEGFSLGCKRNPRKNNPVMSKESK